jgi:hypothetical protein
MYSSLPSGASQLDAFLTDSKHDKSVLTFAGHKDASASPSDIVCQHEMHMKETITALEKKLEG